MSTFIHTCSIIKVPAVVSIIAMKKSNFKLTVPVPDAKKLMNIYFLNDIHF